jgi:hypothetical protein
MGIFYYNGQANTLDAATPVDAIHNQIATAGWVRARISESSPTGNCATGQASNTSTTTTTSSTSTNTSTGNTGSTGSAGSS